jgi:tripartite-type tricarboxylate transporter receptor subunit TctC
VPPARVAALRQAFMRTMEDPELVAEAEKIKLDVSPISGERLQALIAQLYATPADVIDKARQALVYKQ